MSAPSYGLLCRTGTGLAVGAALALVLRREWRCPAGLVLHWAPGSREVAPRVLARPAARRLAASLRDGGHEAWASGRLAFVALPDDASEAAVAARSANAVARRAPCVLVLAGPRPAAVEDLLSIQDGVVIASPDDDDGGLTALAALGLAERGVDATVVGSPLPGLARVGAVTGLALTPTVRRVLAGAVGSRW
jgi:hypothetical protein